MSSGPVSLAQRAAHSWHVKCGWRKHLSMMLSLSGMSVTTFAGTAVPVSGLLPNTDPTRLDRPVVEAKL